VRKRSLFRRVIGKLRFFPSPDVVRVTTTSNGYRNVYAHPSATGQAGCCAHNGYVGQWRVRTLVHRGAIDATWTVDLRPQTGLETTVSRAPRQNHATAAAARVPFGRDSNLFLGALPSTVVEAR
jgi:hypothetical protein